MTAETVSVRLIANAGVQVRWGGHRILLDGIYGQNRYFSPPQRSVQKAVFGMESPYRNVEYLLFTHRHVDHFDAPHADEYAQNNAALRGVLVPAASPDEKSPLEDRRSLPKAAARGVLQQVSLQEGESQTYPLWPGCESVYLRCRHLDSGTYRSISHCAILLRCGQTRLLFAADADFSRENEELFHALCPLDVVFVTPLFYAAPNGRNMLERLNAARAVLYHIPFAQDDITHLQELTRSLLEENRSALPPATALLEPDQELLF